MLWVKLLTFYPKRKSLIKVFFECTVGFESENLRQKLEMEEITGNIKTNPRDGKTVDHDYYFDEKLYESRFKIEQANA